MSVRRLLACFIGIGAAAALFAAALSLLADSPEAAFRLWVVGGIAFSVIAGLALAQRMARGGR